VKQQYGPVRYLEALLAAELEERERSAIARRIFEAKLPRVKTLEEFDFSQAPQVSAARIHQLAEGSYIQKAEHWFSSVSQVPARHILPPGCAWLPVGNGGVRASPPQPL
jgi:IstB-like ATP binding protein